MTRRFQIDIRLQFLNRRTLHFNSFYIMWNVIEYDYYPLMNLIAFYVKLCTGKYKNYVLLNFSGMNVT